MIHAMPKLDPRLSLLARQAIVRTSRGALDLPTRIRIDGALSVLARDLSELIDRGVSFQVRSSDEARLEETPAFGFELRWGEVTCLVFLGQDSARSLADQFLRLRTTLLGSGELTDVEMGILQYSVLKLLDLWHGRRRDLPVALAAFLSAAECRERMTAAGRQISIETVIAGRIGWGRIILDGVSEPAELPALFPDFVSDGDTVVEPDRDTVLHLALPWMTVSHRDLRHAEPGAVLLLGLSDLVRDKPPCTVVTDTMWEVARAQIVEHESDHTRVERSSLDIRVPRPPECGADQVAIRPLLGAYRDRLGSLALWNGDEDLVFGHDLLAPVSIVDFERVRWIGELIRVRGGLGVRLKRRSR